MTNISNTEIHGEDAPATETSATPLSPANPVTRLLVRLGGSSVTEEMSSSDRRLHLATGISMLATGLVAMIGGTILAYANLGLGRRSLIVGILYAAILVTLDRFFIVTSQHLNRRGLLLAVLFRVIIAVSAGYIGAEPIIIDIYGIQIQLQGQSDNEQAWNQQRAILQRAINSSQKRLDAAEQGIAVPPGLKGTTQFKIWTQDEAIYAVWEKKIAPEASGNGVDHQFGCGPVCHLDQTQAALALAQVNKDYAALQAKAQSIGAPIGSPKVQIQQLKAAHQKTVANYNATQTRILATRGFLSSQQALYDIVFGSGPAFITWLAMVLLLVGVDTSPVLIKTFRDATPDEQLRAVRERADRAVKENVIETGAAWVLAQNKSELRRKIEDLEIEDEIREIDNIARLEIRRGDVGSASYRDAQRHAWYGAPR